MMQRLYLLSLAVLLTIACKKKDRLQSSQDDKTPPGKVTLKTYKPLYGGARFFYTVPGDLDLLGVEAVYTKADGKSFTFMSSYFVDSLDVYGFGNVSEHKVALYAVDRAGNRSEALEIPVTPLEPAYSRVAETIIAKPGFSSFFLDWVNELEQNINVYVDYEFRLNGEARKLTTVFSSNLSEDRRFINDLKLGTTEPVKVSVRVQDIYGNITQTIEKGTLNLLEDVELPKLNWSLPAPNDSIGGVPMVFGDGLEGRNAKVIDGIIDRGDNLNFLHTAGRGRTGRAQDGNMPWNFIIELGDYYEISRIVTVQRHSGGLANVSRGQYYRYENVGIYKVYIWDDVKQDWEYVTEHKVVEPTGLTELEFVKKGEAGDMAYMYPDNPKYTKRTKRFRFEAYKGFGGNYTLDDANCLSEITLFGKRSN